MCPFAVVVDGHDLILDYPLKVSMGTANLTYDPYYPAVGQRVEIETEMFKGAFAAVRAFQGDVSGYNR